MSKRIIDLIQENKRRFYLGEIRNEFYADHHESSRYIHTRQMDEHSDEPSGGLWSSLKHFGEKITTDLFYESST